MTDTKPQHSVTRHLNPDVVSNLPPRIGTGPLDYAIPWVIELRIVGTPTVLQVKVTESMTIGRGDADSPKRPEVDLAPYNGYEHGVSRTHAIISARNSRVSIRDLGSSNGTFLNGGRLDAGQEYRLKHGDTIMFGRLELQLFFVVTPSSYEKEDMPFYEVIIPTIAKGDKVLILEEEEQVAHAIKSVLEQAGFFAIWAANLTQALTLVEHNMPDIILMELMLSEGNGINLIQFVRKHAKGANVPIVVVSGSTGGYQMGQAIDAGADMVLTKPVGIDELLRGMSKVVPSATDVDKGTGLLR
ncbi:MAG: response regulator [bacterium]|nr:response regulator [bacterium]